MAECRPIHPRTCSGPPETPKSEPGIVSPVFSLAVTTGHGDTSQVPISADVLADLFRSVPDCPELGWIFDVAARHPSMKVRAAVARHANLSRETLALLADDPCSEIRRQLVFSPGLKRHADTHAVLRLGASDPVIAEELAEHLFDFASYCISEIQAFLSRHPDPSVRLFLAHNGEVSDRTLAALAGDDDPGVATTARRQMRKRLEAGTDPEEGGFVQ